MKEFVEKLIERLEEKPHGKYKDDYGKGFSCAINLAIKDVNQLAEEYEYCVKMCSKDCEVYDKEKHYCPKWCKLIRETVAELKEEFASDINVESKNQDSTKKNQGWIPVTERLPELFGNTSDTVLVCCSNGFQYMAFWCDDEQWRFCECGTAKEPVKWTNIIAWQPLPEPYKPEEKREEPQTNFYSERFNRVL